MNRQRIIAGIMGLALGTSLVLGEGSAESNFDLPWHTMDAGGTTASEAEGYALSGTLGQPEGGPQSSGRFTLHGGFWFSISPTDCAGDGHVDLLDSARMIECLAGPARPPGDSCNCFDVNRDRVVDIRDWAEHQVNFNKN